MVRRLRPIEVGKAGEEQVRRKVRELKVLDVVATRDVATVGIRSKGGIGTGKEKGEVVGGDEDGEVPGERHDAIDHGWNPHQQGDGDLPGAKLTKLNKAFIVVHNEQHK